MLAERGRRRSTTVVELTVDLDEVVRAAAQAGGDEGRADDTEDVIRHRLEVYAEQTAPLSRALRRARACCAGRRHGRGRRGRPARHASHALGRLTRRRVSDARTGIQFKTAEQIALMRRPGSSWRAPSSCSARPRVPGRHHRATLDAIAEDVDPLPRRDPSFLGYHGYPATHLHLGQRRGRARHPRRPRSRGRRPGLDRLRRDRRRLARRRRDHRRRRRGRRRRPRRRPGATEDALWARHRRGAGGRPAQRHRRGGRGLGARPPGSYGIVEEYGGHGIGTAMHMDPHVLNYGPRAQGPRLRGRAWPWPSSRWSRWADRAHPGARRRLDGGRPSTAAGPAHWEHTVALTDERPVGAHRARRRGASGLAPSGVASPAAAR